MATANADIPLAATLDGEQKMVDFGSQLARAISKIDAPLLILLNGDLGAGKTTISRGILQGLGHLGAVKSPTYTLVEPYDLGIGKVFHFDLYRLTDSEELEHIGFTDYLSEAKLCMIEWPENGDSYIPQSDIEINISLFESGRKVVLNAQSERGKQCLIQLKL
ncbi:MAG: tRNA (adenosine(37)-N6)-threonylcarbamoyltransferase complex ATPase subunit type 1 TsaE [Porticoccaceae bacterium]|nr:tRNA (adenosine(37)-N6)-threonylcarbamoyltransferase complex ATPase subunit type 1 TsaE [Porticoccaceae bacterium]